MKKITLLLAFLLGMMTATCFAQDDCDMCGDWIGTYSTSMDENIKLHIRIKKYEDDFSVRVKTIPVKEPENISYWNECNIIETTNKSITFSSFSGNDNDWSGSAKENGETIHQASYWLVCKIQYVKGKLEFTYYQYIEYYDNKGSQIGSKTVPDSRKISLYKEENDW